MSDPFGVDIDCRDDLPPTFSLASGLDNLGNAIARGLMTPAGFLADIDPEAADWGYDLRGKINSKGTQSQLQEVVASAQAQILRDPRIQGVDVTNIFDRTASSGKLAATLETADGPFDLILAVSDVDVTVLGAGAGAAVQPQQTAAAPVQVVQIPGPQGPPGPPGGDGGGGGNTIDDSGEYFNDTAPEEVVWQQVYDFGPAGSKAIEFMAQLKSDSGLSGGGGTDYRLRIGGTSMNPDGTQVAIMNSNSATYALTSSTGTFASPGGLLLIKATMAITTPAPPEGGWIKEIAVKIS